MKNKIVRFIGGSRAGSGRGDGLRRDEFQGPMQSHSMHGSMMDNKEAATSAADLRVGLNSLLGEHVLIAAVATSHALGGRDAAFKGAVGGLDANSDRYFQGDRIGLRSRCRESFFAFVA